MARTRKFPLSHWIGQHAKRGRQKRLRSITQRRSLLEQLEPRQLLAYRVLDFPAVADVSLPAGQPQVTDLLSVSSTPPTTAFLKFDASGFRGDLETAFIRLVPASVARGRDNTPPTHVAYAYGDDQWTETSTAGLGLDGSEIPLATWNPTSGESVEIDVTSLVQLSRGAGDSLISIAITGVSGSQASYFSREHARSESQPTLVLTGDVRNDRPDAVTDWYASINDGTPLVVDASAGLLSNDGDNDGDALSVTEIVNLPKHGNLKWLPDGSFEYTVTDIGYVGPDEFLYTIGDGLAESRPAVVTIDVQQAMEIRIPIDAIATVRDTGGLDEETFVRFDLSLFNREIAAAELRLDGLGFETIYETQDSDWDPANVDANNRPARKAETVARARSGNTELKDVDISQLLRDSLSAGKRELSFSLQKSPDTSSGGNPRAEGESGGGLELIITTSNVIVVNSELDNDDASQNSYSYTTLREAVQLANQTPEPEVIAFSGPSVSTIALQGARGPITISSDMYIRGHQDGSTLTVRPVNGANIRIFQVDAGTLAGIADLLIESGSLLVGDGGAVHNDGDLTLFRVTLAGNVATGNGGAIFNSNGAELTLENVTVAGNSAGLLGGGIYNAGTLSVRSSTIAENQATVTGGGIHNAGTATLANTIVAKNDDDDDVAGDFISDGHNLIGNGTGATGLDAVGDQVGVAEAIIDPLLGPLQDNGGPVPTFSLLVGSPAIDGGENAAAPETDARGAPRVLDGPDPADATDNNATIDIGAFEFGTFFADAALDPGSPTGYLDAVDATPLRDGRVDHDLASPGDQVSLRGAIQELNAIAGWYDDPDPTGSVMEGVVLISPSVHHCLSLRGAGENYSVSGDLDVYGNLTVVGLGIYNTGISGGGCGNPEYIYGSYLQDRIFHVLPGSSLRLENLFIRGGHSVQDGSSGGGLGGGVFNEGGSLEVFDGTIGASDLIEANNRADVAGGGIYSRGELLVSNTYFTGNGAHLGGAIYIESGNGVITDQSWFTGNAAGDGGAIMIDEGELLIAGASQIEVNHINAAWLPPTVHSTPGAGAGIHVAGGHVTITEQVEITRNAITELAPVHGAGIYNAGQLEIEDGVRVGDNGQQPSDIIGGAIYNTGLLTIRDASLDQNSAGDAGALYNADTGVVQIYDTSIKSNIAHYHFGGGIHNAGGTIDIVDTLIEANSINMAGGGGAGGGIHNDNGTINLIGSVVRENHLIGHGGGIYNYDLSARLTIVNSTIEHNSANLTGGGIFNQHGTVSIHNSLIADNTTHIDNVAGAGIYHRGENRLVVTTSDEIVELAAYVNTDQHILYVNDVAPIARLPLPAAIIIDNEPMIVRAVDEFRDALIVERTAAQAHSVTSSVRPYMDEAQRHFVLEDTSQLARYDFPLDILVTRETEGPDGPQSQTEMMTVVALDDHIVTVERGRAGTPALEHFYPLEIWGIGGSLTISDSTVSYNTTADQTVSDVEVTGGGLHNLIHPYVRPTIIENSVFYQNEAPVGPSIWTAVSTESHDTQIGHISLVTYSNDLPSWNYDPDKSLYLQNTVVAGGRDTHGNYIQDIAGSPTHHNRELPFSHQLVHSGNNNLVGYDTVDEYTIGGLSATATTLSVIVSTEIEFPETPFSVRATHLIPAATPDELETVQEWLLVTDVAVDRDIATLSLLRGHNGSQAVSHPGETKLTISKTGLSKPDDRHGSGPLLERTLFATMINEPDGVSASQSTFHVSDTTRFPQVPFLVQVRHVHDLQLVTEYMLVTEIAGNLLHVLRAQEGTKGAAHPDDAIVSYRHRPDARLDPQLSPLLDVGGPTHVHVPLPGSPLLDAGTTPQFHGTTATLMSAAGAGADMLMVDNGLALPVPPFVARVNSEFVLVKGYGLDTNSLEVVRGLYGTSPAAHPVGTTVSEGTYRQQTLLGSPMTATDTQLTVSPVAGLPVLLSFDIRIQDEEMRVLSITENLDGSGAVESLTLTVDRGVNHTQINPHPANASVFLLISDDGFKGATTFGQTSLGDTFGANIGVYMTVSQADTYTQLASFVWADQEDLRVVDTTTLPVTPFFIRIDDEIMQAINVDSNSGVVRVLRGRLGTVPVDHEKSTTIVHGYGISAAAGSTTLNVTDASGLPPAPFMAQFGSELVRIVEVDVAANTLTVERGAFGSTAEMHAGGESMQYGRLVGLDNASVLPATPFAVRAGNELMLITEVDTERGYAVVERGREGTSLAVHAAGFPIVFEPASREHSTIELTAQVASVSAASELAASLVVQTPLLMVLPALAQSTTLSGSVTAEANSLGVADSSVFPAAPFLIRVDDEVMTVVSVDTATDQLQVRRGGLGTDAVVHAADAAVVRGSDVTDSEDGVFERFNVLDASVFPDAPFVLQLDSELLRVTDNDVEANALTVIRGSYGSRARVHYAGAVLSHGGHVEISDTGELPGTPFEMYMTNSLGEQELATVTNVDPLHNLLTVERGQGQTVPVAHEIGSELTVRNPVSIHHPFGRHQSWDMELAAGSLAPGNDVEIRMLMVVNPFDDYTSLKDPADDDDTILTVDDASFFPSTPFLARIDDEVVEVVGIDFANPADPNDVDQITVVRASAGTEAAAHAANSGIVHGHDIENVAFVGGLVINVMQVAELPSGPFLIGVDGDVIRVRAVKDETNNLIIDGTLAVSPASGPASGALLEHGGLLEVHDTSALPDAPFWILLDDELMKVVDIDRTWNVLELERPFVTPLTSHAPRAVAFVRDDITVATSRLGAAFSVQGIMAVNPADNYTALAAAVAASDLDVQVYDTSVLPQVPFLLRIGDEFMRATAVYSGMNSIDVERGYAGTTPSAHAVDASVTHGTTVSIPDDESAENVLNVLDVDQFPDVPFIIQVDSELMMVNSVDAASNTLRVTRGFHTAVQPHDGEAWVDHGSWLNVSRFDTLPPTPFIAAARGDGTNGIIVQEVRGSVFTVQSLGGAPIDLGDPIAYWNEHVAATTLSVSDEVQTDILLSLDEGDVFTFTYGMSATDTQFLVDDTTPLPSAPFWLRIDDELMKVTEVNREWIEPPDEYYVPKRLTVDRGQGGTTAVAHAYGSTAFHGWEGIASGATILSVRELDGFPPVPFLIETGGQLARVVAVDANTKQLTLAEGFASSYAGTPAISHGTWFAYTSSEPAPPTPFMIRMGSEHLRVVNIDGNVMEVERTQDSTLATRHLATEAIIDPIYDKSIANHDAHYRVGFYAMSTLLQSTLDSTQNSVTVHDMAGLRTPAPFEIRIGWEEMLVTGSQWGSDGTVTLDVVRGINATAIADQHVAGSLVEILIDQRGAKRYLDAANDDVTRIDVGATEAAIFVVNTTSDKPDLHPGDGVIDTGIPGEVSLRAAIMESNALMRLSTVILPAGSYLLAGDLDLFGMVAILGDGPTTTTVSSSSDRVFEVHPGAALRIQGLTVSGGDTPGLGGGVSRRTPCRVKCDHRQHGAGRWGHCEQWWNGLDCQQHFLCERRGGPWWRHREFRRNHLRCGEHAIGKCRRRSGGWHLQRCRRHAFP